MLTEHTSSLLSISPQDRQPCPQALLAELHLLQHSHPQCTGKEGGNRVAECANEKARDNR